MDCGSHRETQIAIWLLLISIIDAPRLKSEINFNKWVSFHSLNKGRSMTNVASLLRPVIAVTHVNITAMLAFRTDSATTALHGPRAPLSVCEPRAALISAFQGGNRDHFESNSRSRPSLFQTFIEQLWHYSKAFSPRPKVFDQGQPR
jgi:hypothetical protein